MEEALKEAALEACRTKARRMAEAGWDWSLCAVCDGSVGEEAAEVGVDGGRRGVVGDIDVPRA